MKKTKILIPILSVIGMASITTPLISITSCSRDAEWFSTDIWKPDPTNRAQLTDYQQKWGLENCDASELYFDAIAKNPQIFIDDYHSASSLVLAHFNWQYGGLDLRTRMNNVSVDKNLGKNLLSFEVGLKCTKDVVDARGFKYGGNFEVTFKFLNIPFLIEYSKEYDGFVYGTDEGRITNCFEWIIECSGQGKCYFYSEDDEKEITIEFSDKKIRFDAIKLKTSDSLWTYEEKYLAEVISDLFPQIHHSINADKYIQTKGGTFSWFLSNIPITLYFIPSTRKLDFVASDSTTWNMPMEINPRFKKTQYIESCEYKADNLDVEYSHDVKWEEGPIVGVKSVTPDLYESGIAQVTFRFANDFKPTAQTKIKLKKLRYDKVLTVDSSSFIRLILGSNCDCSSNPIEINFI